MGLLEKLKNTFFEEEYVEVEEPVKEEKVARKVEIKDNKKEKLKKKEVEEVLDEVEESLVEEEKNISKPVQESYSDRDLVNRNNKLSMYYDDDFEETKELPKITKPKEVKKLYGEDASKIYESINLNDMDKYNYKNHTAYGATEANKFQPTPIISPIYGVLDKNYRKEEVIDKKDKPSSYVSRKNADLDSVRRKAYGENFRYFMEEEPEKEEKIVEDEPDDATPILYDMIEEPKPVVGNVTMGDAEEYFNDLGLEYNVDYRDGKYENATGRRSSYRSNREVSDFDEVILNKKNHEDDKTLDDLINKNKQTEVEESANLEDNLFDLVDSMYEGGE